MFEVLLFGSCTNISLTYRGQKALRFPSCEGNPIQKEGV